jgi:hypothetical protein
MRGEVRHSARGWASFVAVLLWLVGCPSGVALESDGGHPDADGPEAADTGADGDADATTDAPPPDNPLLAPVDLDACAAGLAVTSSVARTIRWELYLLE